jgi:hypothetical protein
MLLLLHKLQANNTHATQYHVQQLYRLAGDANTMRMSHSTRVTH